MVCAGPKWMPEMESGLQPVYNIGHVVVQIVEQVHSLKTSGCVY
ncbi:RNA-binding (RRM/RBD/RNP motifs) family protein [Zea mays]|uniref:RNA-binding (RRM/RBD/RNP motifs) family protein n=1 Tax=Zea mays TaxID=4577 RepID=A0A1D6LR66_MAIZE|nr:RNA-binding (RRM/RBD/RNP motifs) family protein [Zea mays]